ncbi:hypothetical protein [Winogradskyella sp.]|uniref:hypothetical protein n=1 Tax=Winogradskyella sp. TaxID=1883156 RepID=UPI003BA8B54F
MKNDDIDKNIMDYVDGASVEIKDEHSQKEAEQLKQIIKDLKAWPLESVNVRTDARLYTFIDHKNRLIKSILSLKHWLPFTIAAASIVVLFLVFSNNRGFEHDYGLLNSNPEKLSFIYDLNDQQLGSKDIEWLKSELSKDISPNIKVTIVDLLVNYQSKLDNEFYKNLQYESIPSVQMALLNSLESSNHINFKTDLFKFSQRSDLDHMVRQKVNHILSNQ